MDTVKRVLHLFSGSLSTDHGYPTYPPASSHITVYTGPRYTSRFSLTESCILNLVLILPGLPDAVRFVIEAYLDGTLYDKPTAPAYVSGARAISSVGILSYARLTQQHDARSMSEALLTYSKMLSPSISIATPIPYFILRPTYSRDTTTVSDTTSSPSGNGVSDHSSPLFDNLLKTSHSFASSLFEESELKVPFADEDKEMAFPEETEDSAVVAPNGIDWWTAVEFPRHIYSSQPVTSKTSESTSSFSPSNTANVPVNHGQAAEDLFRNSEAPHAVTISPAISALGDAWPNYQNYQDYSYSDGEAAPISDRLGVAAFVLSPDLSSPLSLDDRSQDGFVPGPLITGVPADPYHSQRGDTSFSYWNPSTDDIAESGYASNHGQSDALRRSFIHNQETDTYYIVLRIIGEGGFGRVAEVYSPTEGYLAVKVLNKAKLAIHGHFDVAQNEQELWSRITASVDSPFLATLISSFQDDRNLYFVMRLYQQTIRETLWTCFSYGCKLCVEDIKLWAAELLLAIEALHNANILHRDIKPDNVLFSPSGHICLIDYGLAKPLSTNGKTTGDCGTRGYQAPEMLKGRLYGSAADIWAFGLVVMEMFKGDGVPYFNQGSDAEFKEAVLTEEILFSHWMGDCYDGMDLLDKIFVLDPLKRPSIEDIKAHPFFDEFDWELVQQRAYSVGPGHIPYHDSKNTRPDKQSLSFSSYYRDMNPLVEAGKARVPSFEFECPLDRREDPYHDPYHEHGQEVPM